MKNKDLSAFALSYRDHFQIAIKIAITTVGTSGFFGGTGYFLDKKIGTFPILMIVGLVISFPLIQILVYKQTKSLIQGLKK